MAVVLGSLLLFIILSGKNFANSSQTLLDKYKTYTDSTVSISLKYPEQAVLYPADQNPKNNFLPEDFILLTNITMSNQSSDNATELYDGLNVQISYKENKTNLSLDQFIQEVSKNIDPEKLKEKEKVSIGNYPAYKLTVNEWGGGYTSYYLRDKSNTRIIKINVVSVGPDKVKYDKIGKEIISSIRLF